MTFNQWNLDKNLLEAIQKMGYKNPTKVQEKVIPNLLEKKDCLVQSKTGSGKTASYAIPIINNLKIDERSPQALVLAPTRELALQIQQDFENLGTYKKIKALAIFGKQPFQFQKEDLKQRTHVVCGTPGRILDHLKQGTFLTDKVNTIIIDEADEMLNMDFIEDIQSILTYFKKSCTLAMFSATMPEAIKRFASNILTNPVYIQLKEERAKLDEHFYKIEESDKIKALLSYLSQNKYESCLIFANFQVRVDEIYETLLEHKVSVDKIHGGLTQEERLEHMKRFKQGKVRILVGTDVVSRGIDVDTIGCVINFDYPTTKESYIHRIGRSGRMNYIGKAITFVNPNQIEKLNDLFDYLNIEKFIESLPMYQTYDLSYYEKTMKIREEKFKNLRKDITKIFVNGGKNKKLRAGDLVGAICQIDGITAQDIGVIQIQDHHSYVDILNGKGNTVIKKLSEKTIKGKNIKVSKAKYKK